MNKPVIVKIGDFFFKYRNFLFPTVLVFLFFLRPPVDQYWGDKDYEIYKDLLALFIVFCGLGIRIAIIGFAYIKRGGRNKEVYASHLVKEGFFAICRNPLYIGNFIIYFGVFLMHGDPLVIVIGSLFFLFVYYAIVRAEEFLLKREFAEEYRKYCRMVPRWWPKLSRLKAATKDMKFNFKRVLAKDYTTIANALIAVIGIEFYEEIYYGAYATWGNGILLSLIVLCLIFASTVRRNKKAGLLKSN